MRPKTLYHWTDETTVILVDIFKRIERDDKPDKRRRLWQDFSKQLAEKNFGKCDLAAATLWNYAQAAQRNVQLPRMKAAVVDLFWTEERKTELIEVARTAESTAAAELRLYLFHDHKHPAQSFSQKLEVLFKERYPLFQGNAGVVFRRLKVAGLIPKVSSDPEHVDVLPDFSQVMKYWEIGYQHRLTPLFTYCCYKCSALLPDNRKIIAFDENPEDIPIQRHYGEELLQNVPYVKNGRYVRCKKCSGDPLLDMYRLVPKTRDEKSFPQPPDFELLKRPQDRGGLSLCGLFSHIEVSRQGQFAQFEHRRGEVNALHKDDKRYYFMYAMMAKKAAEEVPRDEKLLFRCLQYLKDNNHLYRLFKASMDTLDGYWADVRREPEDDPCIPIYGTDRWGPARKGESKTTLLGDEEAGVFLPNDQIEGRGIDFDNIVTAKANVNAAVVQEIDRFKRLTWITYGERHLEEKIWPWMFIYGIGGYKKDKGVRISRRDYLRWRLQMLTPLYRSELSYSFYHLDFLIKETLSNFSNAQVSVNKLVDPLKAKDLEGDNTDVYNRYGTEIPATIVNSSKYWNQKCSETYAMTDKLGKPDLLVTLSDNPHDPRLGATVDLGSFASWVPEQMEEISAELDKAYRDRYTESGEQIDCDDPMDEDGKEKFHDGNLRRNPHRYQDTLSGDELGLRLHKCFAKTWHDGPVAVNNSYEVVTAFFQKLDLFKREFLLKPGPLGNVTDYFMRVEYQKRGGLHVHMVLWCEKGSIPENVISAKIPRFDHPCNSIWADLVRRVNLHNCHAGCYKAGVKKMKVCKYGFGTFKPRDTTALDEAGVRYEYARSEPEDMNVSPHNLPLLMFWQGHVNVQFVTESGWQLYLCKYVCKAQQGDKLGEKQATKITAIPVLDIPDVGPNVALVPHQKEGIAPVAGDIADVMPGKTLPAAQEEIAEPVPAESAKKDKPKTEVQKHNVREYLRGRLCSSLQCYTELLGHPHVFRSRNVIYLPIETEVTKRMLKRKEHMRGIDPESGDIYYQSKFEKYLDRPEGCLGVTYFRFYELYYYDTDRKFASENEKIDDDSEKEDEEEMDYDEEGIPEALPVSSQKRKVRPPKGKIQKDCRNRVVRQRSGKEAVTYHYNYSPFGEDVEKYCLTRMLQLFPVVSRDRVDILEDAGGIVSFESLSEPSGSYLQECINRKLLNIREEEFIYLTGAGQRLPYRKIEEMAANIIDNGGFKGITDLKTLMDTVAPGRLDMEQKLAMNVADDADEGDPAFDAVRIPLEEYTVKFTPSQRQCFDNITAALGEGRQKLMLVTGGAGVGKSHVIHSIVAWCRDNQRNAQKLGTTGNASNLIKGLTVHCFFSFGIETPVRARMEKGTIEWSRAKYVEVFLVDECSMFDGNVFDAVDRSLRTIHGINAPFGGRSVLLFGDPCQLPAIDEHIWTQNRIGRFEIAILKENMRQKDPVFVGLLNRVRLGIKTKEDMDWLRSRVIHKEEEIPQAVKDNGVVMFPTRKRKDAFNATVLESLDGPVINLVAQDKTADGRILPQSAQAFVAKMEENLKIPAPIVQVKVGCRVRLLRNVDVRHGWVNGRFCNLEAWSGEMMTLQSRANLLCRLPMNRMKIVIPWISTKAQKFYRHQYPVELGYSSTIHTAQGMTLPMSVVWGQGHFCSGQFYTGISRFTTGDDLVLWEFEENSIFIHKAYVDLWRWMERVDVLAHPEVTVPNRERVPPVPFQKKMSFMLLPKSVMPYLVTDEEQLGEEYENEQKALEVILAEHVKEIEDQRVPSSHAKRSKAGGVRSAGKAKRRKLDSFSSSSSESSSSDDDDDDDEAARIHQLASVSLPTPARTKQPVMVDPIAKMRLLQPVNIVPVFQPDDVVPVRRLASEVGAVALGPEPTLLQRGNDTLHLLANVPKEDAAGYVGELHYYLRLREILQTSGFVEEIRNFALNRERTVFDARHRRVALTDGGYDPFLFRHYRKLQIDPDGHCFFRAISMGLFGTADYHLCLRVVCIHQFLADQQRYTAMNLAVRQNEGGTYESPFLGLLEHTATWVATYHDWGGTMHMIALSQFFNRRIINYKIRKHTVLAPYYQGESVEEFREFLRNRPSADDYVAPPIEDQARPDPVVIIMLMVERGSHYSALLPLQPYSPVFLPFGRVDLVALGQIMGPPPGAGEVIDLDD